MNEPTVPHIDFDTPTGNPLVAARQGYGLSLLGSMKTQESRKECPMCAGTGKVRDYPVDIGPNGASTYFTLDPEVLQNLDFIPMYGT